MSIQSECVKVTVALPVQQITHGVPESQCSAPRPTGSRSAEVGRGWPRGLTGLAEGLDRVGRGARPRGPQNVCSWLEKVFLVRLNLLPPLGRKEEDGEFLHDQMDRPRVDNFREWRLDAGRERKAIAIQDTMFEFMARAKPEEIHEDQKLQLC
ncbi:hypothetical protein B0H19DRAFT_1065635 [Mycena capillaripes]|nr:hypothetical protein B0H19DRAFT_1065635 [Mycena capillaripes]